LGISSVARTETLNKRIAGLQPAADRVEREFPARA